MAANKKHPLYQEYIAKCKALSERFYAEEGALRAQNPEWRGKDHPANTEIRKLELQHNADLKSLQQEYSFLFNHSD